MKFNSLHTSKIEMSKSLEEKTHIYFDEVDISVLSEEQNKFILKYCSENNKVLMEDEEFMQPLEIQVFKKTILLFVFNNIIILQFLFILI